MNDMDLELRFNIGNVVRWDDDFWIVSAIKDESLVLLSFRHDNMSAHPSMKWPYMSPVECGLCEGYGCRECDHRGSNWSTEPNPTKTVDTVVFVSKSVENFIMSKMRGVFGFD